MKKILIALISIMATTSILSNPNPVSAEESLDIQQIEQKRQENNSNLVYDAEAIDWDSIDEITVLFVENGVDDEFIADAKARNIPVIYENNLTTLYSARALTYFKSVGWITRNGVRSLSVNPKNPFTVNKSNSWRELANFFRNHPMYTSINNSTKYSSTKNQYDCHVDLARGFKTPWNLEPVKRDKGYWGFVRNVPPCN